MLRGADFILARPNAQLPVRCHPESQQLGAHTVITVSRTEQYKFYEEYAVEIRANDGHN